MADYVYNSVRSYDACIGITVVTRPMYTNSYDFYAVPITDLYFNNDDLGWTLDGLAMKPYTNIVDV